MTKVMTRDHMLMAYVLHKKFGYTMIKIANLMNVSQSTISTSIEKVGYWVTIENLKKELEETQRKIIEHGIAKPVDVIQLVTKIQK